MGKATIQSGGTDGKYKVLYNINKARMTGRIAKLVVNIGQAETVELPVLVAALAVVEASMTSLEEQLNIAINSGVQKEMEKWSSYLNTARTQKSTAQSAVSGKQAEILSLKTEKALLEKKLPVDQVIDAWCADFNERITGEVGTIEVPGERTSPITIKPAGALGKGAKYDAAIDGQITPTLGVSPEESFYNQAMLPGWQRWKPAYRLASITAIDNLTDTCEIVLDPAFSTQKDDGDLAFDANQTQIYGSSLIYTNVPMTYMKCNSWAFGVGDRVVVKFERNMLNLTTPLDYRPRVIGFEKDPKECIDHYLHAFDTDSDIIRSYKLINQEWPEFESGALDARFYTPATITKVYKGKTYVLDTNELTPKITIIVNGVSTDYPLPPIQQDANWYNVKRLEVKDDAIYVHDYAYSYAKWASIAEWEANQLRLPTRSQRMRIMAYSLNMSLTGTTYRYLPYFFSAYITSDRIYLLGSVTVHDGGGYTEGKLYTYNHDWAYQTEATLNFIPGREHSITGWLKEKIIIGNYQTVPTEQSFVYCLDINLNQLWSTGLGGASIHSIVTNGKHVFVGGSTATQGYIYALDINTGAVVSAYTLPVVGNPHLPTGPPQPPDYVITYADGLDTVYVPHRLAVFEDKLYVAIKLANAYLGTTHPRVYTFDVPDGILTNQAEGLYAVIGVFSNDPVVYTGSYFTEITPFAISAGKEAWWLLLNKVDDYHQQVFPEQGGIYTFPPGEFAPEGSLPDWFATNSSAVF